MRSMPKRERRLILGGFVAAAFILLVVGWESYRDTIRVAEAAEARKHSFEIRGLLADVASRVVEAETGERGFLLTENDPYLEPYRGAIKRLDQLLEDLKNATADNPN